METQLQYDSRRKTLGIVAKEHFVTDDNVVRDRVGWPRPLVSLRCACPLLDPILPFLPNE